MKARRPLSRTRLRRRSCIRLYRHFDYKQQTRVSRTVHAMAILLQMTMRKDRRNLTTFGYFKLLLEAGSKRLLSTVALISPFETPQVL